MGPRTESQGGRIMYRGYVIPSNTNCHVTSCHLRLSSAPEAVTKNTTRVTWHRPAFTMAEEDEGENAFSIFIKVRVLELFHFSRD